MPGAGDLKDRVRFEERGQTPKGHLGDWQEHCTVWAQIKWLRGGESVVAQRLEGRQPAAIVVRTSTQARLIDPAFRAVDARTGRTFNIKAVSPAKEAGFIDILAVSGEADG
ncbi:MULTISPECIES: head-tail adaptor protein [unclassified Brevundimonas]|uniref:head-tail adaptor protein n=1 Tax=unclassified Brevundimonas TaxID=2622653 RepID=UPI0014320466|nr:MULTISPECIES: head-tail adaptor protein [unclassified Brevundimonas]